MDVNNIVCCGFNKAYSILKDSKKGCLKDSELYATALFSYQVSVLENHVDMQYSCLTDSQFDSFSQRMQSCCGCCGVSSEEDTEFTPSSNFCSICANVSHTTDEIENDGLYIDSDSLIIASRTNGAFDNFFYKVGGGVITDSYSSDLNYRTAVYIDNPSSAYHGMMAISKIDDPTTVGYIEIWDPGTSPSTPTFVTSFSIGNVNFLNTLNGRIDYDVVEDSIYFTSRSKNVIKVSLSSGTVTNVYSYTPGDFSPLGNTTGYGLQINPVNRKRYVFFDGLAVVAPDSGAIGIFNSSNSLIKSFPFGSGYPVRLWSSAPSTAIVFDNAGDVYMITRSNANDYNITQDDVIKIDGSNESYISSFNYDPSLVWLPNCENQNQVSNGQYYDGTGFISGEKILVLYRNIGPPIPLIPPPGGNNFVTGTSSRLVAFDTVTGVSTDIITIPDSLAGQIQSFNFNYKYNKIFFSTTTTKNVLAYDKNGLKIYEEECFPSGVGGSVSKIFEAKDSNRIVAISSNESPDDNIAVIEPLNVCTGGRVNIINEGIYVFNESERVWTDVIQNANITNLGSQFILSATINNTISYASVQYSTNLTSWTTIEDVTGQTQFTPSQLDAGIIFAIPTFGGFYTRIVVDTQDDCLIYSETLPEPPPYPDFSGTPLTIYRYNTVDFTDRSVGYPTSWFWQFEGGTPSTSTQEDPLGILYNNIGTFDVVISVTNANGTRSLSRNNYINVIPGYIINYVPNASVAFSLRKLDITYTGFAIKVRRDSDNATQDIGFVGQDLDTASLLSFCGTDSGFVEVWYDQSLSGRDAVQLTASEQPQIVSLGTLIETNSKPSILFDGIDDNMVWASPLITASMSVVVVARPTLVTGVRPLVGQTNLFNQVTTISSAGFAIAANSSFDAFPTSFIPLQKLNTYYRDGVSQKSAYQNGSLMTIGTSLLTNQVGTYSAFAGVPGANRFGGEVQELIMYDSYKVSRNSVIQNDVNNYYEIY